MFVGRNASLTGLLRTSKSASRKSSGELKGAETSQALEHGGEHKESNTDNGIEKDS